MLGDIGFELADILEHTDRLLLHSSTANQQRGLLELRGRCQGLYGELHRWFSDLQRGDRSSTESVREDYCGKAAPEESCPQGRRRTFQSLGEATSYVYYWCFKMIINECLVSLIQQDLDAATEDVLVANEKEPLLNHARLRESSAELAMRIVLPESYLLSPITGWLGPLRYWFPLRKATEHLCRAGVSTFGGALARSAGVRLAQRMQAC